jgi:hypothetical protein
MIARIAATGLVAAALAAVAPLEALAQARPAAKSKPAAVASYRCVAKDGKKYYGQTIPPQCTGVPIEGLTVSGTVVLRIDPEGDEKAKQAQEAELEKKKALDAANKEESRRNRALLATYTSVKDIEDARARALADNAKLVKEVQDRIDAIKKRQAGYAKEMEFYSDGKPAEKGGKAKPAADSPARGTKAPPKLVEDIRMADVDLKLQQESLDQRKKQVDVINAKYDEDKNRYLALTQRK